MKRLFLLSTLILLQSCSSGPRSYILKNDYQGAEEVLRKQGMGDKDLYKKMAVNCIHTWKDEQYPKAVEYYIKAGVPKEQAYRSVATSVVWAYETAVKKYQAYGSYVNYLNLIKRVNKARLSRDLQIRQLAMQAFREYKEGKWPSAGGPILAKYLKIIDLRINLRIKKLKNQNKDL